METTGGTVLTVAKYILKPVVFEAIEFTGGKDNGFAIEEWVLESGGTAVWVDVDPGQWNRAGMPEHVRIIKGAGSRYVYLGDYVIKCEDGDFKAVKPKHFEALYEQYMTAQLSIVRDEPPTLSVAA